MGRIKNPRPKRKVEGAAASVTTSSTSNPAPRTPPPPRTPNKKRRVIQEHDDVHAHEHEHENTIQLQEDDEELTITVEAKEATIRVHPIGDANANVNANANAQKSEHGLPVSILLLQQHELHNSHTTIQYPNDEDDSVAYSHMYLTSVQGVVKLLEHVYNDHDNNNNNNNNNDDYTAVGLAVADGTIQVQLSGQVVSILLTSKALIVCGPTNLPMERRTSKKYQQARHLSQALAVLYPNTVVAATCMDISTKRRAKNACTVSAKLVYNLVDNVQLNNYEQEEHKPMANIPGLVPTLRPYQQAAVTWMLQRERATTTTHDEWELAWVVLLSKPALVVPLSDYMEKKDEVAMFYCPFAGWLVKTREEARTATIGIDNNALKGGICADSMGLGKTVEVIACILANRRNTSDQHLNEQSCDSHDIASARCTTFPEDPAGMVEDTALSSDVSMEAAVSVEQLAVPSSSNKKDVEDVEDVEPSRENTIDKDACMTEQQQQTSSDHEVDGPPPHSSRVVDEESLKPLVAVNVMQKMDNDDDNMFDKELDTEIGSNAISNDVHIVTPPSTPEKTAPGVTHNDTLMTANRYGGACICGKERSFKGCLSFVLCESCEEPLHGICAGFHSTQQLLQETTTMEVSADETIQIRLCSADRCPSCVFANRWSKGLIQSRATLIVTPPAILNQWEREISRHTSIQEPSGPGTENGVDTPKQPKRSLKVVVYPGIRNLFGRTACRGWVGRPDCHLIHPSVLADADVVLMTFDSLMGDLGHSDDNPYANDTESSDRLRSRKRYRVAPTPLIGIKWWRVCLDEAQRVEVPTATSARMALKLETEHRWCVSGTPIGRGKLEDLYGLMVFLRLWPFAAKSWFKNCLMQCDDAQTMNRVKHLLRNVMWRSTKASESVRGQMGIPRQVEKKVMLRFSSIEKHFYERQLEQTMLAASDVMQNSTTKKRRSTKIDLLSQHLHKLRAACCHPQVGATGLGRGTRHRKNSSNAGGVADSGVLTMDQILDRLIDDAKLKCEETQRLAVMHTNAMASLSRLKVEARQHGAHFPESDEVLLQKSCDLYKESLDIAERNASPSAVIGEATQTGCQGFLTPRKIIRNGKSGVQWAMRVATDDLAPRELWARYDFEGPAKKICQIKVQRMDSIPTEFDETGSCILLPKECTFQVAHAALGGEFVDVVSFSLDGGVSCKDIRTLAGFRTIRSKAWRLVVKSYHNHQPYPTGEIVNFFVGMKVELLEPDIASDSLQRLHVLHNLTRSMSSLQQLSASQDRDCSDQRTQLKNRTDEMHKDCEKIESLYLDGARAVHAGIKRALTKESEQRKYAEHELASSCAKATKRKTESMWQDMWWDDVLSNCYLNGTIGDREQLCQRVRNDVDSFLLRQVGVVYQAENPGRMIPHFQDVDGLQTGLGLRLADCIDMAGDYSKCMQRIAELSAFPSDAEKAENSHCGKCHIDWNQVGPECSHCKLETLLLKVNPDLLIVCVLESIHKWLRSIRPPKGTTFNNTTFNRARVASRVDERAEKFFEAVKAAEKEWKQAKKAWRIHLDLLNDIDEVNQCKRSMRLAGDDEDLTILTDDELNAIVVSVDIPSRLMDHSAKQAMSLGTLRRHTHTLRFLKNQNRVRQDECVICMSAMEGERAFLSCGHSFHDDCIKGLGGARKSGTAMITCPLRCTTKTKKQDVMLASDRPKDDGTQRTRDIQGSWGTKVTRLVCDLIDVSDLGEKSLVFSQWEDMLWVVEQALIANGVGYARVKSTKKIGDAIKRFRSTDCTVLLLNVKNGAEGLTLVEATHLFMVEPLLNCGLDSQAISRIHRIGQKRTTYVHRFLIEDTIEVKIDKLRMERQEDQIEDSIMEARKKHEIEGGGIDGGFSQAELQDLLK